MCIVWKWITEVGGVKERRRGNGEEKEDRERKIYIFVFQMEEKVYLESLNSFCEVKTLSKKQDQTLDSYFFNYRKFIRDIAAC